MSSMKSSIDLRRRRRQAPSCLAVLLLALLPAAAAVAAPKTDVVVFLNGDRLTGEVKGLERGQLSLKTDAAGTLSIEWARLAGVSSNQLLQVELASGLRYVGQAFEAGAPGKLRVAAKGEGDGREFAFADVVRMDPIDQGGLIARLDGYLTAGYDYTKASDLQQFTFTGGLSNRNEKRLWSADASMTMTSQDDLEDSNRFDVTGGNQRFLRNRRFWQSFLGFEGNDELGLDLRTTLGGAYGTFIVQDARQEWSVFAGLAITEEQFVTQESQESLEGLLGTAYSFFRFEHPKANLDAGLTLSPSLTESGRVRWETQVRSRYEIVSDLFFEISLYGSYDTDPDEQADTKSDYGVTTSLGYSF
jgi:hypothetical protein